MNNIELRKKVQAAAYNILKKQVFVSPVEVLMEIGVLSSEHYNDWRFGRVPYLEKVCNTNLSKLSFIMSELRAYARGMNLKPSRTVYNQYGVKGRKIRLRFSKSGNPNIEKAYVTHYVNTALFNKKVADEIKQ